MSESDTIARGLPEHRQVSGVTVNGDTIYIDRIDPDRYPSVTVAILPQTAVSIADIEDAIQSRRVDAFVVGSYLGTYTWPARNYANEEGVALLTRKELWGALNTPLLCEYDSHSANYFKQRVGAHKAVEKLERLNGTTFSVHRFDQEKVRVYAADEYILSEAFVQKVMAEDQEVQIIGNLSSWNRITPESDEEAKRWGARVLNLSGLYGALHLPTDSILEYEPRTSG